MSAIDTKKTPGGEAYWDKYDIPQMSLKEALWNVDVTIRRNQTRGSIILISEAGEGKTKGIRTLARTHGRRVVDIRTAQFSLMGAGIPQQADKDTGMFNIAVPAFMPKKGEKAIVLFDEVNQGQNHAIAMFFQMLEDRCLYDYQLPDDCIIIGLMNPGAGAYAVSRIEANPALNRRMMKAYITSNYADWVEHAREPEFHYGDFPEGEEVPCHPWVLKYLAADMKALSTPAARDMGKQFCCPATWQTVSLSLYNMDAEKMDLAGEQSERVQRRIGMTIGATAAKALMNYIRDNAVKVSAMDVLTGYKPKSALRKRVMKMHTEPGGDFSGLVDNMAVTLFSAKLPPVEIASHLALFWGDMPNELSQGFYTALSAAAKSTGDSRECDDYMKALTEALIPESAYVEMNARLNKAHATFKAQLEGRDPAADLDPLAK